MKTTYLLYALFFIAWDRYMISLTPAMIKFFILGVVVAPVSIGMLWKDETISRPRKIDIGLTLILSLAFVWLGYEVTTSFKIPYVYGLITCFFTGLFSLPIVLHAKTHLLKLVGTAIDGLGEFIKKFTKK